MRSAVWFLIRDRDATTATFDAKFAARVSSTDDPAPGERILSVGAHRAD
jgi:hypothetical protein